MAIATSEEKTRNGEMIVKDKTKLVLQPIYCTTIHRKSKVSYYVNKVNLATSLNTKPI
jgi:hypothetical protein